MSEVPLQAAVTNAPHPNAEFMLDAIIKLATQENPY